jgi:hypothetical protein
MPVFSFQTVKLHKLPDDNRWEIIGVKTDQTLELIARLTAITDQKQVMRIANKLARNFAGKPYAEFD